MPTPYQPTDTLAWKLTCARSALENWGRHHPWCDFVRNVNLPGECTCGLSAAIADANTVNVANSVSDVNVYDPMQTPTEMTTPNVVLVAWLRETAREQEYMADDFADQRNDVGKKAAALCASRARHLREAANALESKPNAPTAAPAK